MPIPAPLFRALVVWLLIMAAESALGGLRRALAPEELSFFARQVSVIASLLLIFAMSWAAAGWMGLRTTAQALGAGLAWVVLTLAFEVGVARLMGASWARILADYDPRNGALMPLGLLLMGLTPWAVLRLKEHGRSSG